MKGCLCLLDVGCAVAALCGQAFDCTLSLLPLNLPNLLCLLDGPQLEVVRYGHYHYSN